MYMYMYAHLVVAMKGFLCPATKSGETVIIAMVSLRNTSYHMSRNFHVNDTLRENVLMCEIFVIRSIYEIVLTGQRLSWRLTRECAAFVATTFINTFGPLLLEKFFIVKGS